MCAVMRLLRILRASISILSLLLCLATAILWIRSYFTADHFSQYTTIDAQNRSYRPILLVQIGKGGIGFSRIFWSVPPRSFSGTLPNEPLNHLKQPPHYPDFRYRPNPHHLAFLGFELHRVDGTLPNGSTVTAFALTVPCWSLLLLFLLLAFPELLYRYRLYQRRRNPTLCPHCGYDLRASPD